MVETIKSITRVEGIPGLFKGNGASVLRIIPYSAVHFGLYESYRRSLVEAWHKTNEPGNISPLVDLLAGSGSGATAVMMTYPLDIVRTRLAYMTESKNVRLTSIVSRQQPEIKTLHKATIRSIITSTIEREGFRGLYHGLGPSLYGILPYAGLKFYVYQHLKQLYYKCDYETTIDGDRIRLPIPIMLVFGGIAGLIAQTATYPLDVVRRRMQVEGMQLSATSSLPRSTPAALAVIVRQEGLHALFSGLSINYMKVVPSTAIGFSLYDFLKSKLHLSSNM